MSSYFSFEAPEHLNPRSEYNDVVSKIVEVVRTSQLLTASYKEDGMLATVYGGNVNLHDIVDEYRVAEPVRFKGVTTDMESLVKVEMDIWSSGGTLTDPLEDSPKWACVTLNGGGVVPPSRYELYPARVPHNLTKETAGRDWRLKLTLAQTTFTAERANEAARRLKGRKDMGRLDLGLLGLRLAG